MLVWVKNKTGSSVYYIFTQSQYIAKYNFKIDSGATLKLWDFFRVPQHSHKKTSVSEKTGGKYLLMYGIAWDVVN